MSTAVFKYLFKTMAAPREVRPEVGFSALGIMLRYYGLPDITDVLGDLALRELEQDAHGGADLETMARLASWLGFEARCSLESRLDPSKLPAIVQLRSGRFMLAIGAEGRDMLVLDPATGLNLLTPYEFRESWGGEALFIAPTPAARSSEKVQELANALRGECHRRDLIREFKATAVAQGTYGLVYRGCLSDGSPVSIKALPSRGVGDGRVKRFMREVRILRYLKRLDLPGLIRIREIREEQLCYIMEWADGGSLEDLAGPLELRRAVILFTQVARALQGLHDNGLVHRDLSAGNILLFHGDRAKLSDFGFMFSLGGARKRKFSRVAGTYKYLSPEQAAGGALDQKTDIYSLGVILHGVLSGESPFIDPAIPRRFELPPRPLPGYVPNLMAGLIEQCMERDPAARPAAGQIEQVLLSIFDA